MSENNVNMDDLLGGEELQSPESSYLNALPGVQPPVVPQQTAQRQPSYGDTLRKKYEEVNARLMHALGNDYDGYKVDTDAQGNAHFGKKGYAKYEQDKLLRDELRDKLNEHKEQQREERSSAQVSLDRAKQLIKRTYEEEIKYVNKEHHEDVMSLYLHSIKSINWGDANLRSDSAKEGLLSMIFGWAAQKVRRERQANSRSTSGEMIDPSYEDADSSDGKKSVNDFGFEQGSVGFDITQQFADRLQRRSAGPLAGRKGS